MKPTPEQRTAENSRDAARSKPTLQDLKDRVAAIEEEFERHSQAIEEQGEALSDAIEHISQCAAQIRRAIEALVVNLKP